jgi:hypothetical protein
MRDRRTTRRAAGPARCWILAAALTLGPGLALAADPPRPTAGGGAGRSTMASADDAASEILRSRGTPSGRSAAASRGIPAETPAAQPKPQTAPGAGR